MPDWLFRRETLLLVAALVLAGAAAIGWYAAQATVLVVAVAPRDGTEPALLRAYADAMRASGARIRLAIRPFDDVGESADALQDGRADLAVVQADVRLPRNGLTLAILRGQALVVASPEGSGLATFPDLARKRLGLVGRKEADLRVLRTVLDYNGLAVEDGETGERPGPGRTAVRHLEADEVAAALRERRVDAVAIVIAPTSPRAIDIVRQVASVSRGGGVVFAAIDDTAALTERFPRLQAVTIPAGLFGGHPKIPAEELNAIGASYRLMARNTLSRSTAADVTRLLFELRVAASERTEAADYVEAPEYETTAAATSARVPIHPGAVDYYEREQVTFIDRYEDLIYLGGFVVGGFGSAAAWLQQRLSRLRREQIDELLDRLAEIAADPAACGDPATARVEIDRIAVAIVQDARRRDAGTRTLSAAILAVDAARSAATARERPASDDRGDAGAAPL